MYAYKVKKEAQVRLASTVTFHPPSYVVRRNGGEAKSHVVRRRSYRRVYGDTDEGFYADDVRVLPEDMESAIAASNAAIAALEDKIALLKAQRQSCLADGFRTWAIVVAENATAVVQGLSLVQAKEKLVATQPPSKGWLDLETKLAERFPFS